MTKFKMNRKIVKVVSEKIIIFSILIASTNSTLSASASIATCIEKQVVRLNHFNTISEDEEEVVLLFEEQLTEGKKEEPEDKEEERKENLKQSGIKILKFNDII